MTQTKNLLIRKLLRCNEKKISKFLKTDDTIIYTSCFDANGGLFETLLDPEDAVISAKPIFVKTIKNMNINDAINIVKGTNTAGTDYLYENTNSDLIEAFKPNIKSSLDKVDATKHWKKVMSIYNKIPFVKKINPDLELYVTEKTINGLFYILAEEEIEIRKNPQKRTTDLLKKVFGN